MNRRVLKVTFCVLVALVGISIQLLACEVKTEPCPCGDPEASKGACTTNTSGPINPVYGKPLIHIDTPTTGLWKVDLNYSGQDQTGQGEEKWQHEGEMYLEEVVANEKIKFHVKSWYSIEFRKVSGEWGCYGVDGNKIITGWDLAEDSENDQFVVVQHGGSGMWWFRFFHDFTVTPEYLRGRPKKLSGGETGEEVTYDVDSDSNPSTATDEVGRVVTYRYDSDKVSKIIEPNPAYTSDRLDNTHGRLTWFHYDADDLVRVDIGMPKSTDANPGSDATDDPDLDDYYWRRTQMIYDDYGQLTHIIPPDQYDAWLASDDEDKDDTYATVKFEYYPAGHDYAGRVKREWSSGCSGMSGYGTEYTYPDPADTKLHLGSTPAAPNNPVYQLNVYRWENGTRELKKIMQLNANHQLVFLLQRASDSTGWLKRYRYENDYRQLEYVDEYQVEFDWDNPEDGATYSASDQFAGRKYSFDANNHLRSKKEIWVTTDTYKTVKEWDYKVVDSTTTRHVEWEKLWVDSDGNTLDTKYIYDDSTDKLECVCYPQVDSDGNGYAYDPDAQPTPKWDYGVTYYLGRRTFYDSNGRATEERLVQLDNTPGQDEVNWETPGNDEATIRSTKYYYGDADTLDNDGDSSTDETDGSEPSELTRIRIDESGLDLETRYAYELVCGVWRRTSETVDPDGLNLATTYDYDDTHPEVGIWGNRTTVTEPDTDYKTYNNYDHADRLISTSRTCRGVVLSKTTHHYCKYGKLLSTTQAVGFDEERSAVNEYDDAGRLHRVHQNVADLTWAGSTWTGTARGNVTQNNYIPGTNRTATVSRKAGWASCPAVTVSTSTYRVDGKRLTMTDARGGLTAYDEKYVSTGDGYCLRETITDALENQTVRDYDYAGRLDTVKRYSGSASGTPLAHSGNAYDALGRTIEATVYNPSDPGSYSFTTHFYFDPAGNQARVLDPGGNETDFTYDDAGRLIKVTDALENETTFTVDPAGRTTLVANRHKLNGTYRNELVFTWYDDLGRAQTVANYGSNTPGGWAPASYPPDWDYANWPSEPSASASTYLVTLYEYSVDDELGLFSRVTDPASIQSTSYADRLGRTARTLEAADLVNRVTLYSYDQPVTSKPYYQDTITAINDPYPEVPVQPDDDVYPQQVTTYVRADCDDAGRVTSTTYPDEGEVVLTYNPDGSVASRTDQRGWKTTYTYDAMGRVTQEDVAAVGSVPLVGTTRVTYSYDALGRLDVVTDNNGHADDEDYAKVDYGYTWSNDNRLVEEKQFLYDVDSDGLATTITVNTEGERTSLVYPNSRTLTLAYDALHRLNTITDDATGGSTVLGDYDYLGLYVDALKLNADVLRLLFTDGTDLNGYDDWGRIARVYYKDQSPAETRVDINYQYDTVGNPTWRYDAQNNSGDTIWSQRYTYDNLHRLARAEQGAISGWPSPAMSSPDKTWNWNDTDENGKMDKLGNWTLYDNDGTDDERTHDAANKITSRTVGTTHNNPSYGPAGNLRDDGEDYLFIYDYRNRIVEVKDLSDSSAVVTYLYDGFNRRVKKDLDTGTDVVYLYDGWRCIEEREDDSGWEARRQYVHGSRYIDEPLLFDNDAGTDGTCHEDGVDTRYIYCQDANFNVVALTDADGVIVEKTWYEAYGKPTWYYSSSEQTSSSVGNPYLFQGRRYCTESGLYYFRNRDMSPALGRFNQHDPIGYADAMNFYEFVGSIPTGATDPSGLIKWDTIMFTGRETRHEGRRYSVITVKTDAGNLIAGIVPLSGQRGDYHCHGYTFGRGQLRTIKGAAGREYEMPVSITGGKTGVPVLLADEWTEISCCDAEKDDIIVFFDKDGRASHSGVFEVEAVVRQDDKTRIDEKETKIKSKWGFISPVGTQTVERNIDKYAKGAKQGKTVTGYVCYRKKDAGE